MRAKLGPTTTGGGLSAYNPGVDAMAIAWKVMGSGSQGGAYDATNQKAIEPSAVADAFWKLYTERKTLVTKSG